MNKVYNPKLELMDKESLARWANDVYVIAGGSRAFLPEYFEGKKSRIGGSHCSCDGNGEFVLFPLSHEDVRFTGKAYMQCCICGYVSHL